MIRLSAKLWRPPRKKREESANEWEIFEMVQTVLHSKHEIRELSPDEICEVSGGTTGSAVLGVGAAITGLGAGALALAGSPILVPAAATFGIASGGFTLGSALLGVAEL